MTPQEENITQPAPRKYRSIPNVVTEDGTVLKVCTECLIPQSFDNFSKSKQGRDGRYPSCASCCKKWHRAYYNKNKEKANRLSKEWGEKNKFSVRERNGRVLEKYLRSVKDGGPEKFKVCTKCKGNPQPFSDFPINLGHNDAHGSQCRKCMNGNVIDWYYRNKESISEAGREQRRATWAKRAIKSCKQRASKKSIQFDITMDDLYDQRTGELPINCPIFPHIFLDYEAGPDRRLWASVDRIVPEIGYVKGNICVMSYGANTWKSNGSNPEERRRIIQIMTGALIAV